MLIAAWFAYALAADVVLIDGALPPGTQARGTWQTLQRGVHLSTTAPGHMDVLVPPSADWADGKLDATIALGRQPHVNVLLRATHTSPDLEGLSAIGLTIRGDKIQWERWDHGVSLPIAPAQSTLESLAGRKIRMSIVVRSDRFEATILDAASGARLGAAAVTDRRWAYGKAAFRAQGDAFSTLERLTLKDVQWIDPAAPPTGDPNAPLGEDRFVLMSADAATKLPVDLRSRVLGTWPYDDRNVVGALLTVPEYDRLQRSGVPFQVQRLAPLWAYDADVRATARKVGWVDGHPDLSASYKDPQMVEQIVRGWAQTQPARIQPFSIGTSHQGRPIVGLRLTDHPRPDEAPAVLLLGGIHGGELLSTEYALDAVAQLLMDTPENRRLLAGLDIWVVPLLNPDGNAVVHQASKYAGRKNGRDVDQDGRHDPFEGVDLNRNFPLGWGRDEAASRSFPNSMYYRGSEPASEPETQALMRFVEQRRFIAAISFHTNGSLILVPYTLNGFTNPTPHTAWSVADEIVQGVPVQPSGKPLRVRKQIYPVDGTEQDWMRHAFGTIAYTVEGSHHNPTQRTTRLASIAALRPLTPNLLTRVLDGPRVSGRVVDTQGRPVEAAITVSVERLQAGERWTSRPADGRFHRLLPKGGPVQVTARADGYRPATERIDVQGAATVTLVLEAAPTAQ